MVMKATTSVKMVIANIHRRANQPGYGLNMVNSTVYTSKKTLTNLLRTTLTLFLQAQLLDNIGLMIQVMVSANTTLAKIILKHIVKQYMIKPWVLETKTISLD
jgi:hypothetical protein